MRLLPCHLTTEYLAIAVVYKENECSYAESESAQQALALHIRRIDYRPEFTTSMHGIDASSISSAGSGFLC